VNNEDAADCGRGVVERSGGHQNAVAPHLLNVRHVSGLKAFPVSLRERVARGIGAQEYDVVAGGYRLALSE
jgi:hypothetical protein